MKKHDKKTGRKLCQLSANTSPHY